MALSQLLVLTIAARLFVVGLATLSAKLLPPFDSSAGSNVLSRWDVVHFEHISKAGYMYEHEWAFLGGMPLLLRLLPTPVLQTLGAAVDLASTHTLYHLSIPIFGEKIAHLATLLSLLPSSPATLKLAPYNEPFFTLLSYRGMLYCQRKQFAKASLCFTLTGLFRSNSILLGGFILWEMLVVPFLSKAPLRLSAPLYVAPIFLPFLGHNAAAYMLFCISDDKSEWCEHAIPSIYAHVQEKYWGSSFLTYFQTAQIPNFLIAAPPIILVYAFSVWHLWAPKALPFASRSLTPHVLHALILTTIVLLGAHVQIMLRLAASMPVIYWAAAWLLIYHPLSGLTWVSWSVVWGCTSIILWSTFLPPA